MRSAGRRSRYFRAFVASAVFVWLRVGLFAQDTRTVLEPTLPPPRYAVDMQGFQNAPIENVSISDCEFDGVEKGSVVANVNDLRLKNVRVNGKLVESLG